MRKLMILALVIIAFVLGYFLRGGGPETKSPLHQQAGEEEVKLELWTCSMHPQIQLPKSGQCPICWMDLIPVSSGDMGDDEGPRELKMSAKAIKLAEIEVALVERRVVTNEVRMVGKVDYDETRLGYITAWFQDVLTVSLWTIREYQSKKATRWSIFTAQSFSLHKKN